MNKTMPNNGCKRKFPTENFQNPINQSHYNDLTPDIDLENSDDNPIGSDLMLYIYLIENEVNGKVYIGKTDNIGKRWEKHKSKAKYIRKLRNNGIIIQTEYFINALIKHGFEVWKICEIDTVFTQEELDEKEIYWIAYYRQKLGRENVYNIHDGGTGGRNSDEALKKIGRIMSTRWEDDNWKQKRSQDQSRIMTKRWEDGDMSRENQSKSMDLKWKDDKFRNNQCRLFREKWTETKEANSKNGIYLRDPIKNEEEFRIDVEKLTLEQLVKKYKKSLNTIRKNIIYFLGKDFRKKRIGS